MELAAIRAALRNHKSRATAMQARVGGILAQIEELEQELAGAQEGRASNGRRGRRGRGRVAKTTARPRRAARGAGRRKQGEDLNTYIAKVLGGSSKPMGIAEITAGVKKAGYVSSSASLPKIVGMRLSGSKQFKRAGRGKYQLAK
jgi:hypothetical protein